MNNLGCLSYEAPCLCDQCHNDLTWLRPVFIIDCCNEVELCGSDIQRLALLLCVIAQCPTKLQKHVFTVFSLRSS